MYNWYQEGFVVLPQVLLSHYQDLGLSPVTANRSAANIGPQRS